MRLLFLCNSEFSGGAEKYVVDVARGLSARGHTCIIAGKPDSPLLAEARAQHTLQVLELDLGPKLRRHTAVDPALHWRAYRRRIDGFLRRTAMEHGIDALHLQFKKEQLLATPVAARMGLPVIWTEHGCLPSALVRLPPALAMYRTTAAIPRRILCVSSYVRDHLRAHRVRRDGLEVCYNGVDVPPPVVPATRALARRKLGFDPSDVVIGTTSRMYRFKGHHVLLDAARSLGARHPRLRLLIVGDGPQSATIEARVRKQGLCDRVTLTGYRSDVNALLPAMDVLAVPTLSDGLCYAALEAMAVGLPVVASRVGGVPEALGDVGAGILVEPGDPGELADALYALIADPQRRAIMGRAGRRRVLAQFTMAAMIGATERVLRAALGPETVAPTSRLAAIAQ